MRSCRMGCALLTALIFVAAPALNGHASEPAPLHRANYDLAARWTGPKVGKLVFDMAVTPHWLETGDRFWYSFETNQGRRFFLVDPTPKTKKPLFDNAKMAAMLTRITLFPYDAQHLPIRTLKFVEKGKKKDAAIQFEIETPKDADVRAGDLVKSVKDLGEDAKQTEKQNDDMKDKTKDKQTDKQTEKQSEKQTEKQTDKVTDKFTDTQGKKLTQQTEKQTDATGDAATATTKTIFFEYDLTTENLILLESFKAPPKKMLWASLSPDEKTIVFARGHNLFMMDAANYALAQKKADDKAIKETQLTTDGEEHYSFARTMKDDAKKQYQTQEKARKDYRVPAIGVAWSKDSKKFAVERQDERKVADLWVINSLASPRPTPRNVPVRDARRGEPAAIGNPRIRCRRPIPRQGESRQIQGSEHQHRLRPHHVTGAGKREDR